MRVNCHGSGHVADFFDCANHVSDLRKGLFDEGGGKSKRSIRLTYASNGRIQIVKCMTLNTVAHF